MDQTELFWSDFKMNVNLHRSYLDFAMKINMLHYAITGAILSFHFSNSGLAVGKLALALPLLLSFALSGLFIWWALLAQNLRKHIRRRADDLGLGACPEGVVLVGICWTFAAILAIVAVGLSTYVWFN